VTGYYKQFVDAAPIRRQLLIYRHSKEFQGPGRRVPLWSLARYTGFSRFFFYSIMTREHTKVSPRSYARLMGAFAQINAGMRFRRKKRQWEAYMPGGEATPAFVAPERPRDDHANL